MIYPKTAEDEQVERYDLQTNRVLQHLKDIAFYKFTVGDILVREDLGYDKTWHVYVSQCGLPYRYIYAFENELGIGYIRRLSIHGDRFVEHPICVVNFDPATTRFRVDAAYVDHLLLGGVIDPQADFKAVKKRREATAKANSKICVPIASAADAVAFMASLHVGDILWYGWGFNSINKEPCTVTHINLNCSQSTITCKWDVNPRPFVKDVDEVQHQKWFKTKPFFVDDTL